MDGVKGVGRRGRKCNGEESTKFVTSGEEG